MQPISNPRALQRSISQMRSDPAPVPMAMLLFDDRRSHAAVAKFAADERQWLDQLASHSGIRLFVFFPPAIDVTASPAHEVLAISGTEVVKNPSLEVAAKFNIGAPELPGIVFFGDLDLGDPKGGQGVYWPLPLDLFSDNVRAAEAAFAELFQIVREVRSHTPPDTPDIISDLQAELSRFRRSEAAKPIKARLNQGVLRIVSYTGRMVEAVLVAFGSGVGTGLASK